MTVRTKASAKHLIPCSKFKTNWIMQKRLLARIPILILFLCLSSALSAQKKTITGKVTDTKDGSPLPGVSVQAKGDLKSGVVTRNDGSFTLSVDAGTRTLVFSFIGYGTLERPITGAPMDVALTAG